MESKNYAMLCISAIVLAAIGYIAYMVVPEENTVLITMGGTKND